MARLSRIAPEVPVSDLRRAIEFYDQKLGFQVVMEMPDYVIVERDDIAIHLFHDARDGHSPVGLHIFTRELDELHVELRRRGVALSQEIIRKPWGNRDFRLKDDSGNELKFTEPLEAEP
jgi:catechol 2,3-dioxygenase-like lactoylglutathione lyase family enzyme